MKYIKYTTTKDYLTGEAIPEKKTLYYRPDGVDTICIPEVPGNIDYDQIVEEVAAGISEIEEVDLTPDD